MCSLLPCVSLAFGRDLTEIPYKPRRLKPPMAARYWLTRYTSNKIQEKMKQMTLSRGKEHRFRRSRRVRPDWISIFSWLRYPDTLLDDLYFYHSTGYPVNWQEIERSDAELPPFCELCNWFDVATRRWMETRVTWTGWFLALVRDKYAEIDDRLGFWLLEKFHEMLVAFSSNRTRKIM